MQKHPFIELDEHIGMAKIYIPQLVRDIYLNRKNRYSFDLIDEFSRKYFPKKHLIITLTKKIKVEKLDLQQKIILLKELYDYYEKIYKYHFSHEYNPYEDKTFFIKLKL